MFQRAPKGNHNEVIGADEEEEQQIATRAVSSR